MGKSTAAQMFRGEGIAVFDADAQVHRLQAPGGALVMAIEAAFPGTRGADGGIDRQKLGAMVLGNADRLAALEAIIHPQVARARAEFMDRHRGEDIVVFDIPLLFEKGGSREVDRILVVSAPADIQRQRVLARPGMTEAKWQHILKLQMPDAEKRRRADFVIDTGVALEETQAQLRNIIKKLRADLAQNH